MLTGRVNSSLEAVVSLWIGGPEGRSLKTDAIVDTGFSGALSLSQEIVAGLGLLPFGKMLGTLADGSESYFPVYTAIIVWHGKPRLIYVSVVESEPLLGMGMLHGCELAMRIMEGGEVAIHDLG
ncbi:MAG: clan AA aspartic protease [Thermoanaerobaculia bacterium]